MSLSSQNKFLTALSITEAQKMLQKGDITSVQLIEAHLDEIKAKNPELNCYIETTAEQAISQAKQSDQRIKAGNSRALEGIPVAIKDLFCTREGYTRAASKMLENFISPYESTVTDKLQNGAGAISLGKTNMDEFAMGSTNATSYFGPAINPWRNSKQPEVQLSPGGSSGGSAAAVAANLCMASLGSDTGGSVRQPASLCGIYGIKPTYGRCSRFGMVAFASSLDQAGVFARSLEDMALVLEAICGYDPQDSTSAALDTENFTRNIGQSIAGKRIGVPVEYLNSPLPNDFRKAWDNGITMLRQAGAEIVDIELPHTKYSVPVYYILAPAEASANLARYDGVRFGFCDKQDGDSLQEMVQRTRTNGFGREVQRRICTGAYVLSSKSYGSYFMKAQKIRRLITEDFRKVFFQDGIDAILTPSTIGTAFPINEKPSDPTLAYLNDIFTIPANMAGLPAMSLPFGLSHEERLPLGLQLIGRPFEEASLIQIASSMR